MPRPLLLALLTLVSVSALRGQGALTPPGEPAPTMKSLQEISDQIGALPVGRGTPIAASSSTVTLSQPGNYYLTGDVGSLVINGSDVTLDLNGHAVRPSTASIAVTINAPSGTQRNVRVHNGRVVGLGVVTVGASLWDLTYSGGNTAGFSISGRSHGVTVENVTVSNFRTGITASSFVTPEGGTGLLLRKIVARDCDRGIQAYAVAIESVQVSNCADVGMIADYCSVSGAWIENCGVGIISSGGSLTKVHANQIRGNGASLQRCNVSGLHVTLAGTGLSGSFNKLADVVLSQNRSLGASGTGNTFIGAVANGNGGRGFTGDTSIYRDVTSTGNSSDGIGGTGLSIDGAAVSGNGGHGVFAPESTVRGVNARSNIGAGVYADDSTISACIARGNGDDGIRGLNSVISDCRAFGNDAVAGGYAAQDIVWNGGRIANSLAPKATPAIP